MVHLTIVILVNQIIFLMLIIWKILMLFFYWINYLLYENTLYHNNDNQNYNKINLGIIANNW